jgi:mannose-6-phosphate isomerase-like protein (cupin superfamily)
MKAQYFPAAQVVERFGVGNIADAADHRIATARRTGPGESELHERERDVFYILSGEATFVTGGHMQDAREVGPGDWRGTGISGGDIHHLKAGDVITIPAGVAHWFRDVPHQIDYFVVKVIG